ncbi:unnamed protein product [Anisakis simplex]|uniref:Retrotransposon protein n=1 Tax=Anisakis simplex TaxID=6269 RepID=A0A0M3KEM1_ANISI|nr:unnamed protein product [Anisakis simplex]
MVIKIKPDQIRSALSFILLTHSHPYNIARRRTKARERGSKGGRSTRARNRQHTSERERVETAAAEIEIEHWLHRNDAVEWNGHCERMNDDN